MKTWIMLLFLLTTLIKSSVFAAVVKNNVPKLDHVFIIMMENHSFDQIIGNANTPFINAWAHTANLATNYYGVGHPSLTNYLEVVGGSNFGIVNDHAPDWYGRTPSSHLNEPITKQGRDIATPGATAPFGITIPAAPFVGKTIANQLADIGKRWKTYQEDLPVVGAEYVNYSDGDYSNLDKVSNVQALYAVKHNPFVYFENIQDSNNPDSSLKNTVGFKGLNGLYADLRSGDVPDFSFIAPNQCHDMHGIGNGSHLCQYNSATLMKMSDAALENLVSSIKNSSVWKKGNNVVIAIFDENNFSKKPNRVVSIVDTSYGIHGIQSNMPYSHFSLLKTLEAGFGLSCLNHACDAEVNLMTDMFARH